jgi:GDPmannose 4,6-dehydratase
MTSKLADISGAADTRAIALITGVAGQDGSYLAELLLEKGYEVHGIARPGGSPGERLADIADQIALHTVDISNADEVEHLLRKLKPSEIYNLAASSVVNESWNDPLRSVHELTASVTALLDAIRRHVPRARFFQATSSEIFRGCGVSPQDEQTSPRPLSPYGAGKLFGHALVGAYRSREGIHASSGILYNHESPRRTPSFVTRKIVQGAVAIKRGEADELVLGDLSVQRDWGYAKEYVEAMWLMLQQDAPDDFVLATGKLHTVAELVELVFSRLEIEDWQRHVRSDPALARVGDEAVLVGDPSRAAEKLGWQARTGLEELVAVMVDAEVSGRAIAAL